MSRIPAPGRRTVAAVLAFALGSLGLVGGVVALTDPPAPVCGPTGELVRLADGPAGCTHADVAPPGVDIAKPVATADLRTRPGAGPSAVEAAQDLGIATPASTGTGPDVTCDGDGTSGYRTQAMYVVEATATNRYASLKSTLQNWAAGVDDVVNRSAALTGGVRHVRYVTEAGGAGCVASVLNVTVPAGALANFNSSISALRALGYDNPARKYLMWTDTSGKGICGIAVTYPYDTDGQGNPNNGAYPQYARIDSPCWGLGNGEAEHSVEAHELVHTFGAVMSTAPHGTRAGHCWDEYDTMCYADGGGFAMQQVCPLTREFLLDCNSDDYFSTFPDPGSWLDTHWNAADSRFLVGGGDGSGGGAAGTPTVLGAVLGVNNPAVPGLATQVSVTPALPTGRTLASVAWTSPRRDCVFATPTAVQSDVTCSAANTAGTTVTATLVDSTGAKKVVTGSLTFAVNTARPVTAALTIAGQRAADVASASVCTGAPTPVTVTLTDVTTGSPILGLAATLTKKASGATLASTVGSPASLADGTSTTSQTISTATAFTARTLATKVYAAASPVVLSTTVGKCAPALTADVTDLAPWYGDQVTVSGTLTRDVAGATVPVANASLPVTVVSTSVVSGKTVTKVTSLGAAKTKLDGRYALAVKPVVSGTLKVALGSSAAYTGTAVELGQVAPQIPTTALTATADRTTAGYGQSVVVTGRLTKTAASELPVVGATVAIRVTAPGKTAVQVGTGRTGADGRFTATLPLRVSGAMTAVFAGAAGLPAATATLGDVTAESWATAFGAVTASPATIRVGAPTLVTGTATRSYGGATESLRSTVLTVTVTPATGAATTLRIATNAQGAFSLKVYPRVTTTYTVRVAGVAGLQDSAAQPVTVTVS